MRRLAYIDALRGYAILGVIAVHASQYFPNLNWTVQQLVEEGARGVQLFFVASALSLMFSWHDRNDGAAAFYIRRVFRIAPMFWLAIAFFLFVAGNGPRLWAPHGIGWAQIASSVALVHGFHPETLDAIVPGSWSIADEMIFYAIFPVLALTVRSRRVAAIALVISLVFAARFFDFSTPILLAVMPEQDPALLKGFSYLWFPNQLPSFLTGILLFHLLQEQKQPLERGAVRTGLIASVALMVVLPFTFISFRSFPAYLYMLLSIQLQMVYALVFGLFTFCLAQRPNLVLVNPVIRFIGKVSYSAYFWHFAVIAVSVRVGVDLSGLAHQDIYFIFVFMAIATLSIAGGAVTYRCIEVPMIKIGATLLRAMSNAKGPLEAQPLRAG
jgi:exopolysaccharide production protein ExoZ